jgi:large subunit ribosomal protein L35
MHAKGMKSHNRRKKSARVKRQFDRMLVMDETNVKRVKRLIPNGIK